MERKLIEVTDFSEENIRGLAHLRELLDMLAKEMTFKMNEAIQSSNQQSPLRITKMTVRYLNVPERLRNPDGKTGTWHVSVERDK
jgi:hypothetical protein